MYTEKSLKLIPEHMRSSVHNYIMHGGPLGGFLTEVFANSLTGAFARADEKNFAAMPQWADFIYNHCPSAAQGSYQDIERWQQAGGLSKIMEGIE
jgi:hypothetical protein